MHDHDCGCPPVEHPARIIKLDDPADEDEEQEQ